MANPANQQQAARIARDLLVRRLPGSRKGTVKPHLQRAELIAETIWRRWQVGPYQWQVKHLRWYLVEKTTHLTPSTRYRHWLTVRLLVLTLSMPEQWLSQLKGDWMRPTGIAGDLKTGRPVKKPC
ncbi:MAG: hypothetical protein JMN24_01705 [gamma proteobacterium endosymbiont of Lamellibrachia anaximandri]|nr:hypothetical protein [gamma proteobacterium endosymbiont of Lamellibrachia anaximandri]MBL3618752.1 hypothetical protein [gamma proteobacterium endosymbiont of Lamellibrachia anaximandri]